MSQTRKDIRKSCQANVDQLGQAYGTLYKQIEKKLRRDVRESEELESALQDFSAMLLEAESAGLGENEVFPDGLDSFYEDLTQALPRITAQERSRSKKRGILGAVALIAVILLAVWGIGKASLWSDHYVEGQDHAYMYRSLIGGMTVCYAKGEKDYYFMRGKYLYRFDPETKTASSLCTREDCLHSRQPDPIQYDMCNANVVGDDFSECNVAYWEGYVYYISSHDNDSYYTLNRVKEDGSKGETIKKWTRCALDPWRWIIHRGYLYYTVTERATNDSGETYELCYVKRLSLENPDVEEVIYQWDADGPTLIWLQSMTAYGNQMYFVLMGNSGTERATTALYRYDLREKELQEIFLPEEYDIYMISQISFLQEQLVIAAATYKDQIQTEDFYFAADLDGSNMCALSIPGIGYLHSDGNYLYVMEIPDTSEDEERSVMFHVYDGDGREVDSMAVATSFLAGNFSDFSMVSLGDEEGIFWIVSSHERKMWDLYWIDKSKIGSWKGKALELEPVDQLRYGYAYVSYLTESTEE